MNKLSEKWTAKINIIRGINKKHTGDLSLENWLNTANETDIRRWQAECTTHGVHISNDKLARVNHLLSIAITRDKIERSLKSVEMMDKWRKEFFS